MPSGFAVGLASWPDAGALWDMLMTGFGAVVGAFLIVMMIAALVDIIRLRSKLIWLPIAVRVAVAWVTAVAMLLGAPVFKSSQ